MLRGSGKGAVEVGVGGGKGARRGRREYIINNNKELEGSQADDFHNKRVGSVDVSSISGLRIQEPDPSHERHK